MFFLVGYVVGVCNTILFTLIAYKLVKWIWPRYGNAIVRAVDKEGRELQSMTYQPAQIINPDYSVQIFKNESTNLEDQIQ